MQSTITKTELILADMLTENTGTHMLDSGGAYGRHWQRNEGLTVEDFRSRPAATLDRDGFVTLDLFHYLRERLEYLPEADRAFQQWVGAPWRSREPFMPLMSEYAVDVIGAKSNTDQWFGTFDGEGFLSQDFQGMVIHLPGDEEGSPTGIFLQVHGGADIRGGYTTPRIFRVLDCEGYGSPATVLLAGMGDFTISAGDQWGAIYRYDFDGDQWFDGEPPRFSGDDSLPWDDELGAFIAPNGEPVKVHAPEPIF